MAYTPQQNRVVEMKNRTLVEIVNAMLTNSSLNNSFWREALLMGCYILNILPHKKTKVSP